VLRKVKERRGDAVYTKSGIMLGLGETKEELMTALQDLRGAQCDILTLGQYLQPTLKHLPVVEFVVPAKFEEYGERARQMGFVHVASGPMVRSSYHADDFSPAAIKAHSLGSAGPLAATGSQNLQTNPA
jgi:lipoic acid synthetase